MAICNPGTFAVDLFAVSLIFFIAHIFFPFLCGQRYFGNDR